jgi:DNA-binding NarL/FixJ family response regulator
MVIGNGSVKVFLADDSALIRSRVAAMLAAPALTIVGHGETPAACIAGIRATQPDVVVLDVQLNGGQGLEVLEAIHPTAPGITFIVFTNNAGAGYRKRYLRAGAFRFLDKSAEFDQLLPAVKAARDRAPH